MRFREQDIEDTHGRLSDTISINYDLWLYSAVFGGRAYFP